MTPRMEQAIAELASAIVELQQPENPVDPERRFQVERAVGAFVRLQLQGATHVVIPPEDEGMGTAGEWRP